MDWDNCMISNLYGKFVKTWFLPISRSREFSSRQLAWVQFFLAIIGAAFYSSCPFLGFFIMLAFAIVSSIEIEIAKERHENSGNILFCRNLRFLLNLFLLLFGFWTLFFKVGTWVGEGSFFLFSGMTLVAGLALIQVRLESLEYEAERYLMDSAFIRAYLVGWSFLLMLLPSSSEGLLWLGVIFFWLLALIGFVMRLFAVRARIG